MDKLCRIRDLQRAVNQFEANLEKLHGICMNEGMALCSLSKAGRLSCGELGEMLGLTPSNTSKVLRSVENKGFVSRELGTRDKRQMYFSLTERGRELLASVNCKAIETPEILKTLFGE
ncbi:MarR family transcriptional regulator [uncultured Alistipes sp.]|jgi:DNA-binding MarR family transcriptional regulator|uniref:MarR family transcriptional regulator n=1 Tax=uncultured Alistipes sp. TaxID=538949 RepID=UPI0025F0C90B|nr:MarR family transcriptional regulator [uncultured Alistipes sp.]